MRPKSVIYVILYLLIYIGFVQKYLITSQLLALVPDILIFYLSLVLFRRNQNVIKRKFVSIVSMPICILFVLLVISSIVGALLNLQNLAAYLWGLRILIRYPLLVWLIYKYFDSSDVHRFKQILYTGFRVNIVCCFFQFFRGEVGDLMSGTFTGNDHLMLYTLLVFILSSADRIYKLISLNRYILIIAGSMLIAIWAEIKVMYFLFPLAFYALYVLLKKFTFKLVILLVLGFFFLIPFMQFFMSFYYGQEYVEQTFNADFIAEETSHAYGFKEGGFNRSTAIEKTDEILLDTPSKKIFGNGLGSGSISTFFGTGYSTKYDFTMFWNFSTSYCLTELGWLGFTLYFLFFFFIILRFYSVYKSERDLHIKYWASVGIVCGFITYIIAWYNDNVYFKYLPMYFLWGICLVAIQYRKRELYNLLNREK